MEILSASARSSFFLLRCSRRTRASSVSRHRLVVAAIPTAAQAITALVRQCKTIHEKPRVREQGTEYPAECAARRLQKSHTISRCEGRVWGESLHFVALGTIRTNSGTI